MMDVGRPKSHRRKRRSSNYLDERGQLRDREILSAGWNQGTSNGTNMRGLAIDEDLLAHPLPLSVVIAIVAGVLLVLLCIITACCITSARRSKAKQDARDAKVDAYALKKLKPLQTEDEERKIYKPKHRRSDETLVTSSKKDKQRVSKPATLEKNHRSNYARGIAKVSTSSASPVVVSKRAPERKSGSSKEANRQNNCSSSSPLIVQNSRNRRRNIDNQIINNLRKNNNSHPNNTQQRDADSSGTEV